MSYTGMWARAFALTLLVELGVAWLGLPRDEARGRRAGSIALANLASHPAVWFVFPALGLGYTPALIASELWAVGSEVLAYKLVFPALAWRRAALVSLLANSASLLAGWSLRALGVPL